MATTIISDDTHQPFRVIKSKRGGNKMVEGGFVYGQQPSKRVKTQGNEQALKDLILSYMYRPRMEFLRGIAHHFNMDSH